MDGMIAMETGAVGDAAQQVRRTGDQLAADWAAVRASVARGEAELGTGRIADAFRAAYSPGADQLRTAADQLPPRFTELADAAVFSADAYGGANDGAADRFRMLGE